MSIISGVICGQIFAKPESQFESHPTETRFPPLQRFDKPRNRAGMSKSWCVDKTRCRHSDVTGANDVIPSKHRHSHDSVVVSCSKLSGATMAEKFSRFFTLCGSAWWGSLWMLLLLAGKFNI